MLWVGILALTTTGYTNAVKHNSLSVNRSRQITLLAINVMGCTWCSKQIFSSKTIFCYVIKLKSGCKNK